VLSQGARIPGRPWGETYADCTAAFGYLSEGPHGHRLHPRRPHPRPAHPRGVRPHGQRQRPLPRRPPARDGRDLHRRPPRGRGRRRGRCALPHLGTDRRGDHHLRGRLHQHADGARGGRPGTHPAGPRGGGRADLRTPALGRGPDRAERRGRGPHLHRGPVVLAIPYDVAQLDIGDVPTVPGPGRPEPLAPTADFTCAAIQRLARDLAGAERPLLLAGRGAWLAGAGPALGTLAEATGALTATTALGRGIFPQDRYDLGVAGGFGGPGAMATVREADVALVVGADLNQFTMRFGELFHPDTTVWQIDTALAATHAR